MIRLGLITLSCILAAPVAAFAQWAIETVPVPVAPPAVAAAPAAVTPPGTAPYPYAEEPAVPDPAYVPPATAVPAEPVAVAPPAVPRPVLPTPYPDVIPVLPTLLSPAERRAVVAKEVLTRANTRAAGGNYAGAVELYNIALGLAPTHAEALLQRGLALSRLGAAEAAQDDFDQYQRLVPWASSRLIRVADTVLRGNPSGMSLVNQQAIGEGYYEHAVAAQRAGQYARAVAMTSRAAERIPSDQRVAALAAQAWMSLGEYDQAAQQARIAVGLGPVVARRTLDAYYADNEVYQAQLKLLEEYVRDNPSTADTRFLLGYQYMVLGDLQPAREQLAAALGLTPADLAATELLAEVDRRDRIRTAMEPATVTR